MEWSKSLTYLSHNFENTCLSLWTPCLAFGFNKQKFDTLEGQVSTHWCGPALAYCGSNIVGSVLLFSYGSCFFSAYHLIPNPDVLQILMSIGGSLGTACYAGHFRRKIREKYNITGSLQGDICTHMWCSPCALCQETAELRHQNDIVNGNIDFTKAPYIQIMLEA